MGNCDMSKCATMTKEECAKMCDEKGCTPEQKEMVEKNVKVEIIKTEDGKAKATVTTSENGKENTEVFEGSLEEVKAQVEALK